MIYDIFIALIYNINILSMSVWYYILYFHPKNVQGSKITEYKQFSQRNIK